MKRKLASLTKQLAEAKAHHARSSDSWHEAVQERDKRVDALREELRLARQDVAVLRHDLVLRANAVGRLEQAIAVLATVISR